MSNYAIPLAAGIAAALLIAYDARGRRWHGWFTWATWTALTVVFGLLVVPFYLVARTRSTKRVPGEIPAGWYTDPRTPTAKRYWDGRTWTDHVTDRRSR